MYREIYENGQLIERIPLEENIFPPDWETFNTDLFYSQTYLEMAAATTNQEAKIRLESYALNLANPQRVFNFSAFQFLWNAMISGLPEGFITPEKVDYLKNAAIKNNMEFTFDGQALLIDN